MGATLAVAFAMMPVVALLYFQPWKEPLERLMDKRATRKIEKAWHEAYDAELARTGDRYDAIIAAKRATWPVKGPRGMKMLDDEIAEVEKARAMNAER